MDPEVGAPTILWSHRRYYFHFHLRIGLAWDLLFKLNLMKNKQFPAKYFPSSQSLAAVSLYFQFLFVFRIKVYVNVNNVRIALY